MNAAVLVAFAIILAFAFGAILGWRLRGEAAGTQLSAAQAVSAIANDAASRATAESGVASQLEASNEITAKLADQVARCDNSVGKILTALYQVGILGTVGSGRGGPGRGTPGGEV